MKPAHELTKSQHEFKAHPQQADASADTGYVEKEYEHQEYPKVLPFPGPDGKDLVAKDEKHEAELIEKHGPKEAAKASE